jgi:hypothetical protein
VPEQPPPPGSPQEARAILITIVKELRALNAALAVHAKMLTDHSDLMRKCLGAGVQVPPMPGAGGVIEQLGALLGGLGSVIEPEEPPPPPAPRRRR